MTSFDLIAHVRTKNPNGRGRPYNSIHHLVKVFEGKDVLPKRLTVDMRLRLYDALDAVGIHNDRVLSENARYTQLWCA